MPPYDKVFSNRGGKKKNTLKTTTFIPREDTHFNPTFLKVHSIYLKSIQYKSIIHVKLKPDFDLMAVNSFSLSFSLLL